MKRIIILMIFLISLSACGADPDQFTEVNGPEKEAIEDFLLKYKETMVEAVNTGDFNELEGYLITNNSFYHSLRRYISDSHSENITKELNHFEVITVYEDEIGEFHIDVNEKVTLFEYGEAKPVERAVRFEVITGGNGSYRVVTIKERK
ncbi:TcaA NTF2-like domain-containing protein [Halalkalibacter krulwichiae]|uniref:TcaA protein NTF2-like domain-containing protein n=1 Tax=Halalkalibacter krulwichiae TaxID=199441 RepID=A0A1X9MKH3_9BACI|nr:hypothetical protein [Halalkalibacter krulwichiae]ARK31132.1 hypothetical protein BkAM31D_15455 [Halalkalibacter krulwichiae]